MLKMSFGPMKYIFEAIILCAEGLPYQEEALKHNIPRTDGKGLQENER
jgi:hypothetical protein